ncbi:MAG: hypothetical protein COB02_06085 [Candidatus Cloacimonadota bacterium]|nr:MAG: hypothetical protein COB02_12000 [Candidatus Cloacimonadota bacterium]PCJ20168.1 MAG: hypothetical protein COB02_06085 [Candidatus Cloacimonadota bacterium]
MKIKVLSSLMMIGLMSSSHYSDDLFEGFTKYENLLEETIHSQEVKSNKINILFTQREVDDLTAQTDDIDELLSKNDLNSWLKSSHQKNLLREEKRWQYREGGRKIYKLLNAIRIKSFNYILNEHYLLRLKPSDKEYAPTKKRADKFRRGISVSNVALKKTIKKVDIEEE